MFIAQLPQIPSRQLLRNVKVGSSSFLILIRASSIIGPVLFRSSEYVCIFGLELGSSGFHRYTWKDFIFASLSLAVSLIGLDFEAGSGARPGFGRSPTEANDRVHAPGTEAMVNFELGRTIDNLAIPVRLAVSLVSARIVAILSRLMNCEGGG